MGQKSIKRTTAIIGMAPDLDPNSWDQREVEKYGLGKVRDVSLFYKIFLIDLESRKTTQLCPFVKTGVMHKEFIRYLRQNGMGIDYSHLENFDTKEAIAKYFLSQHPYWKKALQGAMRRKHKADIRYCLDHASRVRMEEKEPQLIREAKKLLKTL